MGLTLVAAPGKSYAAGVIPDNGGYMVPFLPLAGHGAPLVTWRIGNDASGVLLIDTGSNVSLLTDSMAKRLRLKRRAVVAEGHQRLLAGAPAQFVIVPSMSADKLVMRSQSFLVIGDKMLAFLPGSRIDGVIGMDVLHSFAALFDFPGRKLTLWRGGKVSRDLVQERGIMSDPLVLQDPQGTGVFWVKGEAANGETREAEEFLLSTGANTTIVSSGLAERLGLVPLAEDGQDSLSGRSMGLGVARIDSFRIGGLQIKDLDVDFAIDRGSAAQSTLGMDALGVSRLLIDWPAGLLYIANAHSINLTVSSAAR